MLPSEIDFPFLLQFVAFEAFWAGSWQPVELLKIDNGTISTHILKNEDIIKEDIPLSHLRVRSRKATWLDCTSFLRPGIDVCVLSASGKSEDADDERNNEPVSYECWFGFNGVRFYVVILLYISLKIKCA